MFNPPSSQRRPLLVPQRSADCCVEDSAEAVGPLLPLVPGERVYVCRSPTVFKEPVANKHYQQPAIQEVLRHIKALDQGDWCIWELLFRKESFVQKIGKEVRNQVLPYRVPDLSLLTVSFVTGFVSSILYWLNMDRQNIAIVTIHDECESHQCLLFSLAGVLRWRDFRQQAEPEVSAVDNFDDWLRWIHRTINERLFKRNDLSQVRSPITAKSQTSGIEPFMVRPWTLLPSETRYLRYIFRFLGDQDIMRLRDVRTYKLKCVIVENFLQPAASVVLEIYHLNNTPLENGQLQTTEWLKRRKRSTTTGAPSAGDSTSRGYSHGTNVDEWEQIWWSHLKDYQKRYKRHFGKSKDPGTHHTTSYSQFSAAHESLKKLKLKPLLTTAGDFSFNVDHPGIFKADQSISLLPTSTSLAAESLGAHDTGQGACCQWNFANQNLSVSGDIVIVLRQVMPVEEHTLKTWALDEESPRKRIPTIFCSKAVGPNIQRAACERFSLTAMYSFNTSFLESECLELTHSDFNFYSPPDNDHTAPINLRGIFNKRFKVHLILNSIDDELVRPPTTPGRGALTARGVGPAGLTTTDAVADLEDADFMTPINPQSPSRSSVPVLNLSGLAGNILPTTTVPDTTGGITSRKSTHAIGKFFNFTGGGDKSARKTSPYDMVNLEEWLKHCLWRERNRRLCFDLRGDVSEFISRHCVIPDFGDESCWAETYTKQEMIVCLKCCDNTIASEALAAKLFAHESSIVLDPRAKEKRSSGRLKSLISKLNFTKNPFRQSNSLTARHLSTRGSSAGAQQPFHQHRRTGSYDNGVIGRVDSFADAGSEGDGDKDDHQTTHTLPCKSPPARLATRNSESLLSALRDAAKVPCDQTQPADEVLTRLPMPKRYEEERVTDATENPDCRTTKSSESQNIPVLKGTLYEPPKFIIHAPAPRIELSTEASSEGQRTAESASLTTEKAPVSAEAAAAPPQDRLPPAAQPQVPKIAHSPAELPAEEPMKKDLAAVGPTAKAEAVPPAAAAAALAVGPVEAPEESESTFEVVCDAGPNRLSLPTGLMAALNKPRMRRKSDFGPMPSQAEATQTQPRMPADLKSALLNRSSLPTANTNYDSVADAPTVKISDALKAGIAGGIRKSVPEETEAPPMSLAASMARRSAAANAAAPKSTSEPAARKAPLGRKLFWKPLETANLSETIFGELGEGGNVSFAVDRENVSKIFSKDAKKGAKRNSQSAGSAAAALEDLEAGKKKVKVIDDRRAQNVGIVVLRLKTTPTELASQLLSMEFEQELAGDMLEKLESIFFTDDEEVRLEQHLRNGSEEDLRDVPERRLLPLRRANLPRGRARTRILGADLKWQYWLDEMESSLDIVKRASREMRSCACFRVILSAVLRWGNFVNYGSNELHIKAITLSSLLKLTDFKTAIDSKVTSLHYIVATLLASAEHVEDALIFARMTDDLGSVRAAAKITSEVLESGWKQLMSARDFVRTELSTHLDSYKDQVDPTTGEIIRSCGLAKLKSIEERMRADIDKLEAIAHDAMSLVQSTARFFGDEEAAATATGTKTQQFFVGLVFLTLDEFLRKFDDCIKDIVRRTPLYASILNEDQTQHLVDFVTTFTGKPLSKSAMMAIEANRDFNKIERAKCS